MAHLFIFGLGYTARHIAQQLWLAGWKSNATGSRGDIAFENRDAVLRALDKSTHVLSSVPPDRKSSMDPVLASYGKELEGRDLFYLSSTGVYGDARGAWVDESTPTVLKTGLGRRNARAEADATWSKMGARVFRLPGIYGPGRSAFDRIREGKARRIDVPNQVFSRIHVHDIASAVAVAAHRLAPPGAYNLGDDLPASGNAVTEEACRLLGITPPPLQTLEEASLSEMARGFYSESRRVANGKAKRVLGWRPEYPTYKEGLASLA